MLHEAWFGQAKSWAGKIFGAFQPHVSFQWRMSDRFPGTVAGWIDPKLFKLNWA